METLGGILGGLGTLGIVGAILLWFLLVLIVPIWSIFDCAYSERDGGTKALIIILLLLSCSLGALIYSLFFPASTALRKFAIGSLCVFVILLCVGFSTLACGAKITNDSVRSNEFVRQHQQITSFRPGTIATNSIAAFRAIHWVGDSSPKSAVAAEFTGAGPQLQSAVPLTDRIRHVLYYPQATCYFALTTHEFGVIHSPPGDFEEIDIDPSLKKDFSWPKGLAADPETGEIVILCSHVDNKLFFFNPQTQEWRMVPVIGRDSLIALAYSPEDKIFYALRDDYGQSAISTLKKVNRLGADIGSLSVVPPIPIVRGQNERFQMTISSKKIVLLVPAVSHAHHEAFKNSRIFVIDPENGKVCVPMKVVHSE